MPLCFDKCSRFLLLRSFLSPQKTRPLLFLLALQFRSRLPECCQVSLGDPSCPWVLMIQLIVCAGFQLFSLSPEGALRSVAPEFTCSGLRQRWASGLKGASTEGSSSWMIRGQLFYLLTSAQADALGKGLVRYDSSEGVMMEVASRGKLGLAQ